MPSKGRKKNKRNRKRKQRDIGQTEQGRNFERNFLTNKEKDESDTHLSSNNPIVINVQCSSVSQNEKDTTSFEPMQAEVQIFDESTTSGSRKRKFPDKNKQDKDTIHAKKHMVTEAEIHAHGAHDTHREFDSGHSSKNLPYVNASQSSSKKRKVAAGNKMEEGESLAKNPKKDDNGADYDANIWRELSHSLTQLLLAADISNKGVDQIYDNLKLDFSNDNVIQECIRWIVQATTSTTDKWQLLFLCALLGYVAQIKKVDVLSVPHDDTTKIGFDKLLYNLEYFFKNRIKFHHKFFELLANSASTIVEGCSKPGWLTLAAYFGWFFDMEYVLKCRQMDNYSYSKEEFKELLPLLVYDVESVEPLYVNVYERYLKRILQFAPDDEVLFQMFQDKVHRFFLSQHHKERFFIQVYSERLKNVEGSLAKKIAAVKRFPEKMRQQLHGVYYACVLNYIYVRDPLQEDVHALCNLIIDLSHEHMEDVLGRIIQIQPSYLDDLFHRVLNDKKILNKWKKIVFEKRASLCADWIRYKIESNGEKFTKVKATLSNVEKIISCSNVASADDVKERLFQIFVKDLRQEDPKVLLEESKELYITKPCIRKFIADVIQDTMKKNEQFLRRNGYVLQYLSSQAPSMKKHTGYEKCLLKCALNVLNPPKEESKDMIEQALQFCDIWVELVVIDDFRTKSSFQAWRKIWKIIEDCIMKEDITVSLFEKIKTYQDRLSCIFCGLNSGDVQSKYLLKISKLSEVVDDFRTKYDLLLKAENFAVEVLPGWSLRDGISEVNDLKSTKCNKISNMFLEPFGPLLQQLESLKVLLHSVSFSKFAKTYLQKNPLPYHAYLNIIDRECQLSLFEVLSTQGIRLFEIKWQQILCNSESVSVGYLKGLLESLNPLKLGDELSLLERQFQSKIPPHVRTLTTDCVSFPRVLEQTKHIKDFLCVLEIDESSTGEDVESLLEFLDTFDCDESCIMIEKLHEPMGKVEQIISQYNIDRTDEMIIALGKSRELIRFIREIVNDDIRVLIDAVEEHSEEAVSASLVSDLIQVHGFLVPVIEKCSFHPNLVLMTLVEQCKKQGNIARKIRQCSEHVHSLRGLYQKVANREELTRGIIKHCLANGVFKIKLDSSGSCHITMSYRLEIDETITKSMDDLQDLRSRAHLILSSEQIPGNLTESKTKDEVNFHAFIKQVNLLSDIEEAIINLQSSGYVKYQKDLEWESLSGTKDLEETKSQLSNDFKDWQKSLCEARKNHYFLNYFWSDQLSLLYNFISSENISENDVQNVVTLIKFVDPNIDAERLMAFQNCCHRNENTSPFDVITAIGKVLDEIFSNFHPPLLSRKISDDNHPQPNLCVHNGELYIVALEKDSVKMVNVMLSLYENTTNAFPEPHQVLFCHEATPWEQLQLFLIRCFNQSKNPACNSLFCLSNVEHLSNEVQFNLVDYIKKKEFEDREQNYLLAIICRCDAHHHIIEEFSKFVHHISGMSYPEIASRFKSKWPHVKCVTSTLQGLGKTEYIRNDALEKSINAVSFPISGQVNESKIIERLKKLSLTDFQCLHFDIDKVDDPVLLDVFLFQLIVMGIVSYGTQMYFLHGSHVYIEISNCLNNQLAESLLITRCFSRVELSWKNYDDLKVSSNILSNIQVVCQYLNVFEKNELDNTDVFYAGSDKVKPLFEHRCRELLRKHYGTTGDMTFSMLHTFLGFLADQLRKFSKSTFFEVKNLKEMLEDNASGVRKNLFEILLHTSKDFASRSLSTCDSTEAQNTSSLSTAQNIVQRMKGMIQWEESNHLLIVFQNIDSQTIAAFYRDKSKVPSNIRELLKSQIVGEKSKELVDFKELSHEDLHKMLEKIACTRSSQGNVASKFSGYALTADNMLKMILIILRVRAKIPIIIMGETGCGKTSLVQYLASTCGIPFSIYNFHAGRTDDEIREFVEKESDKAQSATGQRWIFLDEINTCHHLGLINEIMCHHTLLGHPISRKLIFIAACNPYKLRSPESSSTAGLEGKKVDDEYSKLVYRVHPLPESMVDYVWDYGSLTPQDEKVYIGRMVNKFLGEYQQVLTELLALSQNFIRHAEKNPFCVSLRDVRRCILLVSWFIDTLKTRKMLMEERERNGKSTPTFPGHLEKYKNRSMKYDSYPEIKSIVLALAHCYMSRLLTNDLRQEYIRSLIPSLASRNVDKKSFKAIIRMEQEDYLSRMELPEGTARNAALRENVFVMLVSILNRIPVFVVGKPGCSKSLAIQLIRSNLRGKDSKDAFFKTLRHLYVVSYQGSESSTSEGIEEIFKKASNYKEHNSSNNVLPVVLLDEVGLAENSPNNPLKVLHSILEPGKGELPDVAVVGISNWALDAAKMNRAIHLSRPEPSVKDLSETAISLYQGDNTSEDDIDKSTEHVLCCLAEAYYEYRAIQSHSNFHGLRDYYSLVKSLRGENCRDMKNINISLKRNFGGIPKESSVVKEVFNDRLKTVISASKTESYIPVRLLIEENLKDLKARHLMLISNGDSAIGILKQHVSYSTKETITIFGSNFEEDISDDYNYRILSRIILCMERNCILILRDLECIYGSLYDMLNQNYSVVGGRKNCRVALGANSNPMCYVDDGFRCIVLIDQDQVDYSDPPFLNRFEKQLLRFSDMLNETQQEIMKELESWVQQMSSVEGFRDKFKEEDVFIGFNEDTLPSLVLYHSHDFEESKEVIIKKCKDDLMWIATPDGVLRTRESDRYNKDPGEIKILLNEYFEKPIHNGLASFISHIVKQHVNDAESEACSITLLMTHATVHTDISRCMNEMSCQLERLGAYKSGKQLEDRIHIFFKSEKELLIIQCKPELDAEHMLFTRSIVEEKRNAFTKKFMEAQSTMQRKHVCMIVHVRRASHENTPRWQLNFLSGWKQVFLDTLEIPSIPMDKIFDQNVDNLLSNSVWSFRGFAVNCILWCFNCLKYSQSARQQERVLRFAKKLFLSHNVSKTIRDLVIKECRHCIEQSSITDENWQVKVACDVDLLFNSWNVSAAMEQYLLFLVRQPLAKLVYFMESENSWPPHLLNEKALEYEALWCDLLKNQSIFDFKMIPECKGVNSYSITGLRHNLKVPFSQVIAKKIQETRSFIMKEYAKALENEENYEENGILMKEALVDELEQYSNALQKDVPCIILLSEYFASSYMADMFDITSANFHDKINVEIRIPVMLCAFLSFTKPWCPLDEKDPTQLYALLHLFLWISGEKINRFLELVSCFVDLDFLKYFEGLMQSYLDCNEKILSPDYLRDDRFCVNLFYESDKSCSSSDDSDGSDSEDLSSDEKDDEVDDGNDQENEPNKKENFEEYLVTSICEYMFPSEKSIHKNGGLDNWMRNSKLLLTFSSKVCNVAPAYHFLRLCVDFGEVVQQSGIPKEKLYILNEVGTKLDPEYLDDNDSLLVMKEKLLDDVEHLMRDDEKNQSIFRKFMSQYYSRHVEAKMERTSSRPIIEYIFSLNDQDILTMIPVLYRLLYIEEALCPGIYIHIVVEQKVGENQFNLKDIDKIFIEQTKSKSLSYDSYLVVMICDLIQFIQRFDENYFSSERELMNCYRSATRAVTGCGHGIVFLSSIAFLRGFYTMLSRKHDILRILTSETKYSIILSEINSLLEGDDERRLSIRTFFLKRLYASGMTMYDLKKLCCASNKLPVLKEIFHPHCIFEKMKYTFAVRMEKYEEIKEALLQLRLGNDEKMADVAQKCENNPSYRVALLGNIINVFYVERTVGNLSDDNEKLARKLYIMIDKFPLLLKHVVSRLLGIENFEHPGLQISAESSVEEIDLALLILHIVCVVYSSFEVSFPLLEYVLKPEKNQSTSIFTRKENKRVLDQYRYCNEGLTVNCLCKFHLQYRGRLEKCPNCGKEVDTKGYGDSLRTYFDDSKSKDWETCTVNMKPSVYRALHLIVNACLYGGIAAGLSSNEMIFKTLFPDNEDGSLADACLNQINEDLKCLQTILSCKRQTAIDVMHLVVEESTPLLKGVVQGGNTLINNTECMQWESKFIEVVSEIFFKAFGSAKPLKELKIEAKLKISKIEYEMQELDQYPTNFDEQNRKLKRLFRITREPSFAELRAMFFNSSKEFNKEHPVLAVLLSWFDELPYLSNLYPLLNWTRYVISTLTNRISRKEVENRSISDLIDGVFQQEGNKEKEERKTMFQNFKVAWNKMHKIVNQHLDENQQEMPYIGEDKPIGYCLLDGDLSVYLKTAITILQSMQNSFLDSMIATSLRTKHPAVSFLTKSENCCGVMSISLQEVKEKDIINIEWSNKFLRYTQNPEYGCGEDIDYDFEQIENILTNEVVLEKLYLTDISSTFIFSLELFHSSANVLMKIRELCPQSPTLPEGIDQGIETLKERRKQDARNLLQNIEIIIYLLHSDPKSTEEIQKIELVEFADTFKDKLPRPFPVDLLPEPKKSIHLTHIAALYEALEDVLADGTIEGLPIQFRADLKVDIKEKLNSLVHHRNGPIKAKQFLQVLRRFAFRYLSAEKFHPEAKTPLRSCLQEPSLWTPGDVPEENVIPRELVLANIKAIIKRLQQEQSGQTGGVQNLRKSQPAANKRKGNKRSIATNFDLR
ncbi:uncharacterized protein LOC124447906 [Xenia sp. Carnegie-2017]|uniref:uncharacterized protein LOC124447906 n=1 Tax=Xenia sp. Carnegie-2017 TaxID=2897299 RepID=UPI001F0432B7|nr:uncharacterized protein LOC124447906 [Xenia sp. Carnegie-2017]XP_046854956.1 uncharacterized protein LOC124447906 [Xenia sp. Carnegie-2017]